MSDTFLNIYPRLLNQATAANTSRIGSSNSNPNYAGLWLAHGEDPLLHQWLTDAFRSLWQAQSYAIKRLDLVSSKTWYEAMSELNSLSLFDDATALIVTGNHKPDKRMQTQLEEFGIESNSGANQNCLLWLTGKVDKRAQSSKWFAPFAKTGQVIDSNIYDENQRQQLLHLHAQRFGLQLTPEAWQLLMEQTEHHLLSAYQALWRLSYLFIDDKDEKAVNKTALDNTNSSDNKTIQDANQLIPIDIEALQNALVSDSHYSVFDLSDAMLAGDVNQVIKIIGQLKATDEPTPLVLWAVSKDMRLIMQLMDGQDPQSLGIWRNKKGLYQSACRRQTKQSISDWSDLLYDCDKAIKGLIQQPAWELLLQAVLRVTGHRLFA